MKFVKKKQRISLPVHEQGLAAGNRVSLRSGRKGGGGVEASLEALSRGAKSSYPGGRGGFAVKHGRQRPGGPRSAARGRGRSSGGLDLVSDSGEDDDDGEEDSSEGEGEDIALGVGMDSDDSADDFDDSEEDDESFSEEEDSDESDSDLSSAVSSRKGTGPRPMADPGLRRRGGGKASGGGMFSAVTPKEAEEAEKNDLLARFHVLKQRGVHISKTFTPRSSLQEMRMEMGRIEHEARVQRSLRINRRFLLAGTGIMSKVTDKYGPKATRGLWHGFDKHLVNYVDEFDEPFERLSEEYGGVVKAVTGGNPIWEIACMLLYQAVVYALEGGGKAKADESFTSDEIRRKYPNIIKEAVQKELASRREEDEARARTEEMAHRERMARFEAEQARAQATAALAAAPAPQPIPPPPAFDLAPRNTAYYDTRGLVNSESGRLSHDVGAPAIAPLPESDFEGVDAEAVFSFDDMRAALPQIEEEDEEEGGDGLGRPEATRAATVQLKPKAAAAVTGAVERPEAEDSLVINIV
jgi:hypothetical protein